ncbi:hypothetical protein [Granulicella sibirica]|uniref:Uncharacterized protein n=1 Tax=Granulicella sibirica TaxID=2479048 RepID=A0A4Q0SYB5_9BACT|nr:hypothetical protein [Granulicella sibirica]RXH54980.1 hypothetical protein GRAN_4084 [Granulicella sibirica]
MGTIDDVRKVIQDLVAPDLKALSARIDGLEKTVNARFDAVEKTATARFESVDSRFKGVDVKFEQSEKTMNARFDTIETKIQAGSVRLDALAAQMAANHAVLLNALEIDKRLARLEEKANPPQHV